MISLLPIEKVISVIAMLYGSIVCIILWFVYEDSTSLTDAAMISFSGATVLNFFLFIIIYFGWKKIWNIFPSLNHLLFPNLNGKWDIIIHWQWGKESGVSNGLAYIKQDFIRISMEVEAKDSDSETLMAKPKKDPESGRPILYYVYRIIPKKTTSGDNTVYEGAAILKLDHRDEHRLEGNYFTSRHTVGRYELTRKHT